MGAYLEAFYDWFDEWAAVLDQWNKQFWSRFTSQTQKVSKTVKPVWSSTYNASMAMYTIYSTVHVTLSLIPILGTFATFAPFLSELTSPWLLYSMVALASVIAGYFKYHSLIRRDALDEATFKQKEINAHLNQRLEELENLLNPYSPSAEQTHAYGFDGRDVIFSPISAPGPTIDPSSAPSRSSTSRPSSA